MSQFIYTGPSWAELSYDKIPNWRTYDPSLPRWINWPYPHDWEAISTNLAKQWDISYIDVAQRGASNSSRTSEVQKHISGNNYPIIWVLCEPLVHTLTDNTAPLSLSLRKEYLTVSDHFLIRRVLKRQQLAAMNNLNRRIGIIGAHSDITDQDVSEFKNLTIIDHSWQNFLANLAGVKPREYNFGYEVAQRIIHGHQDLTPNAKLVNDVYEGLEFWKTLEDKGVFCDVHPNRYGTEEYAKYTKDRVVKFINENS